MSDEKWVAFRMRPEDCRQLMGSIDVAVPPGYVSVGGPELVAMSDEDALYRLRVVRDPAYRPPWRP